MKVSQRYLTPSLLACLLLLSVLGTNDAIRAQDPPVEEVTAVVEPPPTPDPADPDSAVLPEDPAVPPEDPAVPPEPVTTPEVTSTEQADTEEPLPLPPDEGLSVDALVEGISWNLLWVLMLAIFFGGAGGVVYELLILEGNIERFHKTVGDEVSQPYPYALARNLIDLGIWARVIIGGLAAVIAIWLLDPKTTYGLIAGSIIAGSAGTSVFRSLQDRLMATLARDDAAETRRVSELQQEKLDQALASIRAARGGGLEGMAERAPDPSAASLDEAERLLTEARGIGQSISTREPR